MTCIAAVADGKRVVMGGDSCASTDWSYVIPNNPKVFHSGEFLIGGCGSFRLLDALRFNLDTPSPLEDMEPERYVRTIVVDSIRDCLGRAGFKQLKDGVEDFEGSFLLGFRGNLYIVQYDFSVLTAPTWGAACGSGEIAAMASLWTMRGKKMSPAARVRMALEAAEACVPSVRGPFVLETV